MIKNTGSQTIGAQMVSATDGSAFTGAVTVYVCGDAGTQAQGSVGSGACTHEGNGYHTYAPAQAETNYNLIAFTFTGSGAVPATVQVETVIAAQTGDSFARLGAAGAGLTALGDTRIANLDAAVSSRPTATAIDSQLSGTHGAGAWTDAHPGTGASSVTLTIEDADSNPVADCEVWVTSDSDGSAVVAGPLVTDDDGTVTFLLDTGVTYYCWRRKSGYNFTNPQTFVAAGD